MTDTSTAKSAFFERVVTREQADAALHRLIAAAFKRTDVERPHFSIPTRGSDDDVSVIDYLNALEETNARLKAALPLVVAAVQKRGPWAASNQAGRDEYVRLILEDIGLNLPVTA